MPAPLVIAGLLAVGSTIFGKVYDSISARVGKKKAKQAVEKAIALQQKDKKTPQEEQELKSLIAQYPEIQQGFSQYAQTSADPRFTRYGQSQLETMGKLRQGGLEALNKNNYNLEDVANYEVNKFQNEVAPSIAARFSGMGQRYSSGYERALARAQSDAALKLRALGYEKQGEAQNRGLKALELGLQPEYGSHGLAGLGQQQQQPTFGAQLGSQVGDLLKNPEFLQQASQWWQELGANRAAKQNALNEPYSFTEGPKYQL